MKKLLLVMSALSFLSACPVMARETKPALAVWGGQGIEILVNSEDKKASVRFDCAAGSVLNWVSEDELSVGVGTYTREVGALPPGGFHAVPASYAAKITDRATYASDTKHMTLTLILEDGVQTFELTKGIRGTVHYCP